MAVAAGAGVIVMDDGFQNPSLAKDFSVLVVDGDARHRQRPGHSGRTAAGAARGAACPRRCAARGRHMPPGSQVAEAARARGLPIFRARLRPDAGVLAALGGSRVLAFAGIGDPAKFFATLAEAGIAVAATRSFPDHHRYTRGEAQALCEDADRQDLVLVTTEKDLARLTGDDAAGQLAARARALPVELVVEDEERFKALLLERIAAARTLR